MRPRRIPGLRRLRGNRAGEDGQRQGLEGPRRREKFFFSLVF
jgi:hypothetical protein